MHYGGTYWEESKWSQRNRQGERFANALHNMVGANIVKKFLISQIPATALEFYPRDLVSVFIKNIMIV